MNKSNVEKLKVVLCTPQEHHPVVLTTFLKQIKDQPQFDCAESKNFNNVFDDVINEQGAVIMISVASKEELPEILNLLSNLKSRIDSGTHKVMVYNEVNDTKATPLLRSKGVSEVVEQNVSLKALHYKFNNTAHLVEVAVKRVKNDLKNKSSDRGSVASSVGKVKKTVAGQVVFSTPIEHFSDFWLLMNPKQVRFVIGKWFVNFYGPGPSSGSWELYPEKLNGEEGWIWNPRQKDDKTFYQDGGRWVFFGNCPEFSWEEKHWYFISKRPEFAFYVNKKPLHKKIIILENGDLQFAENSKTAKNLQGIIAESIDASVRLQDSAKAAKMQKNVTGDSQKPETADFREKKLAEKEVADFRDKKAKEKEAVDYTDKKEKKKHTEDFHEAAAKKEKRVADYHDHATAKDKQTDDFHEQSTQKEKRTADFRDQVEKNTKEYNGRFSEKFEERKKKYEQSYDCTELNLGLVAVNQTPFVGKVLIQIVELREKYIVLDIPADLLKVDDLIELEAIIKEKGIEKKVTIGAATQIVETEPEETQSDSTEKSNLRSVAICELNDVITPQFVELLKAFKEKHDHMNDFFSKAKGVA